MAAIYMCTSGNKQISNMCTSSNVKNILSVFKMCTSSNKTNIQSVFNICTSSDVTDNTSVANICTSSNTQISSLHSIYIYITLVTNKYPVCIQT